MILQKYFDLKDFTAKIATILAEICAVTSVVTYKLKQAIEKVKSSIGTVERTKKKIDALLASKRNNPSPEEIVLQNEIANLNEKEKEANSRLSAATMHIIDIEENIRSLKEERSLNRFLAERTHSEEYRKHLGLISTIRQDFEVLTERLAHANTELDNKFNPVDRIILYIDDLDRCPSNKVMEVLQAVHLLLAYPLFIVVVGVDPRWLISSLGKTFAEFQNSGTKLNMDSTLWEITPQNFLEKIFQIPFSLRPMTENGFGKLMTELLTPTSASGAIIQETLISDNHLKQQSLTVSDNLENTINEINTDSDDLKAMTTSVQTTESTKEIKANDPSLQVIKQEQIIINEGSLIIQPWEARFAENLFNIIPSPRAAKRFSNIYRILKASIPQKDLIAYEGSADVPGEFQVPMLLLSILTYNSTDTSRLFKYLQSQASIGYGIKDVLLTDNINIIEFPFSDDLFKMIKPIIERQWFPNSPRLSLEWIPRVSRFSFEIRTSNQ